MFLKQKDIKFKKKINGSIVLLGIDRHLWFFLELRSNGSFGYFFQVLNLPEN